MRRMNWRAAATLLASLLVLGMVGFVTLGECRCDPTNTHCYEDVIVSGGGTDYMNGTYQFKGGLIEGRPWYQLFSFRYSMYYGGSSWWIYCDGCIGMPAAGIVYSNPDDGDVAPNSGWEQRSGALPIPTVSGGCACTPGPSISVAPTVGVTTEAGGTATFTLTPNQAPTADVTVPLSSSDTSEGTVPASVTLPAGSVLPVTVTVTAVDDDVDDGDIAYTIVTGDPTSGDSDFNDLGAGDVSDVSMTNFDDDTRGITVAPTSGLTTTEAGGQDTFTVVLDSEPTGPVTIGVSSDDPTEGTPAPTTLAFMPSDWDTPQTVTVTGVDDAVTDGDIGYTIVTTPAVGGDYAGLNPSDVSVTNTDDDIPGINVTPTSGLTTTEAGGTATFSVKANTAPTADVTVPLSSSDTTEGTVPASVVLPAGSTDPVTVTVTGVNDDVNDGDVGYTIVTGDPTSGDGDYGALGAADVADVSVTNLNDDWPWITVKPTSGLVTTEDGGTATFTVVLDTQPLFGCASPSASRAWGGVTIDLSSSNPAEGTVDPGTLVFTEANWDQPQTVTVTGVDDAVLDGDIIYVIVTAAAVGGDYNGFNAADVIVTNLDDEVAIVIVPTGAGGPEEFLDVVLPLGEGETPPLVGDEPLVASYVVGDLITGSCQFLGPSGNPTADGYIHLYLYSVDITATPEALELIAHWTADFNWTTFEFEFAYDSSGLTPGYYDLRLSFPDGTSQTFRIEVTPAV